MDEQVTQAAEKPRFWRRHPVVVALGGAVGLIALVFAGYLMWLTAKGSPQAALVNLASAAVSGDATTVAESIDTTSVVHSAIDDAFSESLVRHKLVAEYLAKHPNATEETIKAKALALVNTEMREHVESGELPKRIPLGDDSLKELAAKAFAGGSVRSVKVKGNTAHVLVAGRFRGRSIQAWLLMKRVNGKWKVVKIENLPDVIDQAGY